MGAPTFVDELDGGLTGGDSRTFDFSTLTYTDGDLLLFFPHHADLFFANQSILRWEGLLAPAPLTPGFSNGVQDSLEIHALKTQVSDPQSVKLYNSRSASGASMAVVSYTGAIQTVEFKVQTSNEGVEAIGAGSGTQTFDAVPHDLGPGDKMCLYVCLGRSGVNAFTPQDLAGPTDLRVDFVPRCRVQVFEQMVGDADEFPAEAIDWTANTSSSTFERMVAFRLYPVAKSDTVFA